MCTQCNDYRHTCCEQCSIPQACITITLTLKGQASIFRSQISSFKKSNVPDSWLSTISPSTYIHTTYKHTSSYSGMHMGMYIRRQRIPQCSLPPKTALPRLRGGLIATLAAEIMFPCEVRTSRTSNEVGLKFVRSWLEVRSKLARSSFEVGPKFVRS